MPAKVTADLKDLRKAHKRMARAAGNLRKVWRKLRTPLRKDQREHMRAQEDSKGGKWKPLSTATRERRISKGGRAGKLTKRGRLKKKVVRDLSKILGQKLVTGARIKIDRREISITSKAGVVAGAHQKGLTVGKGSRLPKREFFYISTELAKKATIMLAKHMADAFNKK